MFLLHTNPYLHNVQLEEKHIIMGAYTIYLALGNNLVCRSIQSETISHYLSAIGEHFDDHDFVDPTLTKAGKRAKNISNIIKEQSRWESIADRREPLTIDMIHALHQTF